MKEREPRELQLETVEDEPGKGKFMLTIKEGKSAQKEMPVKPLNLRFINDHNLTKKEGMESLLEIYEGQPVIAFRIGNRGCCAVVVNPNLLNVKEMSRSRVSRSKQLLEEDEIKLEQVSVPEGKFYTLLTIFSEEINIEGVTKEGNDFYATIGLVSSPELVKQS